MGAKGSWKHGTDSGYRHHGCRCDACKAANAAKRAEKLAAGKPKRGELNHGTVSAYNNWGCRCEICVEASSERARVRRTEQGWEPAVNKSGQPRRLRAEHGTVAKYQQGCRCAECVAIKSSRHRWENYGLTDEAYQKLLQLQNNLCAICEVKFPDCVDHDHDTGKIRGLLCRQCNRGLGMFGDNLEGLNKAVKYLTQI